MLSRVERHVIKRADKNYNNIKELCHRCKNLYNYCNYILRQSLFREEGLPNEYGLTGLLVRENQDDYRALPAQTSQQVIKLLYKNWKSYFQALRAYQRDKSKFFGCPKIPKYKPRGDKGHFVALFTNQQIRLRDGKINPRYKGDKTERSNNFIKATRRLAKLSERIANIRKDFNHKETSKVVAGHKFIAMETLNVTGMVKNRKLAKSISDVSYSDLSFKIEYKARYSNRYIYYADMFFASSKTCLNCLNKNSDLKLSDRIFVCPSCGFTIDRDTAAAINLREEMERYLIGIAHPEFTLVERSSVDDRSLGYLRSTFSMKQEDSINLLSNRA